MASLTAEQRREYMHNLMRSAESAGAMVGEGWKPAAVIGGTPVCFSAVQAIYGCSTATVATAVKSAKELPHDTALLAHGNKVRSYMEWV